MHFEDPVLLFLLILLVPLALLLFVRKRAVRQQFAPEILAQLTRHGGGVPAWVRHTLLLLAAALMVTALARPVLERGEIKVTSSTIDLIVAFDISRSMLANDVYPDRLTLAKRKFETFLDDVNDTRIGVIGFSSRAFLIAPLTEDFATLRYLVGNMDTHSINLQGTSILDALEQTDMLLGESERKAMLLLTDGGDATDFDKEIAYAKSHNIVPFIYNIGTEKGGVVPMEKGAMTDDQGNIVVVRRNDAIRTLALKAGGAYLPHSLAHDDIAALAAAIKTRFAAKNDNESTIRDVEQLYVYPLGAAAALLFLGFYGLPRRDRA